MGAGAMIGSGMFQADQERQAGKREQKYYNALALTSRRNAALSLEKGEVDVNTMGAQQQQGITDIHDREREVIGGQKAALVGGAGVGSKTAEQLVSDTETKTNLDEMALRYNYDLNMKNTRLGAKAEALGYEEQAYGYNQAGRNSRLEARAKSFSTLVGAASSVGTSWAMYNPAVKGK